MSSTTPSTRRNVILGIWKDQGVLGARQAEIAKIQVSAGISEDKAFDHVADQHSMVVSEEGEAESRTDKQIFADLAIAAFERSDAAITTQVKWVIRHMAIPLEKIEPDSVPDPASVVLLQAAREKTWDFFQTYHSKLLPSKGTLDQQERFEDDGRELTKMTDALLSARTQENDDDE